MKSNTLNSLKIIEERLDEIKGVWIPSSRKNDTGVGKTLEDFLGKEEDNLSLPDFDGLEVKSQRLDSTSLITLFTKSPSFPRGANSKIRTLYGQQDDIGKVIHTSIQGNKTNKYKNEYGFSIHVDRKNEKINLNIYDKNNKNVKNNDIHWSFKQLKNKFKKIESVCYVQAQSKKVSGVEHFKYEQITLLLKPSFENFLKCIENGKIIVDIRVGVYRSGKRIGKTHDHGTAFRINKSNFNYLFEKTIKK